MKRYLALILSIALVFSTQVRVNANPAALLLGAEGLALLEGLAIKQGLRFAGSQAAKAFFRSAVKKTPSILSDITSMTRSVSTVGGGTALKYTLSAAAATTLMTGLAGYAGDVDTLPYVNGTTPLEYYDAYVPSAPYVVSGTNWELTESNRYLYSSTKLVATYNFGYLDKRTGTWITRSTGTEGISGSQSVAVPTQLTGSQYIFTITYKNKYGDIYTFQESVPDYAWNPEVLTDGSVVLHRYPFPKAGVATGEPRALPIPGTGEFDIYIPLPVDQAYDVLEGNPTFVDTPIDGTTDPPPTTTNPPPYTLPTTATFNFQPLQLAGDQLTNKFPFSIPWDIKRQLSVFDVDPQTPVMNVDIKVPAFGTNFNMKFKIDFSMFDPIATVVRWFLILAFDVALILGLRKFLPE